MAKNIFAKTMKKKIGSQKKNRKTKETSNGDSSSKSPNHNRNIDMIIFETTMAKLENKIYTKPMLQK